MTVNVGCDCWLLVVVAAVVVCACWWFVVVIVVLVVVVVVLVVVVVVVVLVVIVAVAVDGDVFVVAVGNEHVKAHGVWLQLASFRRSVSSHL